MVRKYKNKPITQDYIDAAENAIREFSKTVKYMIMDYSYEFIVDKLNNERYYVPEYQRNLIWLPKMKSKFIESMLMGLPIPFIFFWQAPDGRMEIVDGSQRLRTMRDFMQDGFALKDLEKIPEANGLKFSDFSPARQLKLAESPIRVVILDPSVDAETRTEMFARINTTGRQANEAEIRRGSLPGPFMEMIVSLSENKNFVELTPLHKKTIALREREELITRFFAYFVEFDPALNNGDGDIPNYKEEPRLFYADFVKKMNMKAIEEIEQYGESLTLSELSTKFEQMMSFVKKVSPYGFTKSRNGKQIPRVRFEAIAVGSAIALAEKEDIYFKTQSIEPILKSTEFAEAMRSDAANVKSKLIFRINLVRKWLLGQ